MGVEVALTRFLDGADDRGRRAYVELGRGEFGEGRSLDALLAAYRVGARVAWRRAYLAGEEAGVDPHALYELGEAMFAYIDAISAESADGWAQAQSAAAGERQRARRRLVSLLSEPVADEGAVRELCSDAAWELPGMLAAIALAADDSEDETQVSTRLGSDVIAATVDGVLLALVPDPSAPGRDRQLVRALDGTDAALGPQVAWQQATRSIGRARLASALQRDGRLPSGFVRAGDHLPTLLLHADAGIAEELVQTELAPLDDLAPGPQAKLTATLRAWLDHRGRVEEVAHALGVHPQTVRYRLGQLRELLGDRLEDPEGRLALALALRAQ
jgi:hypothetical protein